MTVPISFSGVPFYFFSGRKGGPWQSSLIAQSSIVPFAANVTASIEGRDARQFGGLTLTAWRPYTQVVPAPPSGELPVGKAARIRGGERGHPIRDDRHVGIGWSADDTSTR